MEHEERFYLMMMDALDGALADGDRAELESHLRVCADCTREWRTLLAVETLFRQTPLLMPAVDFAERTLARLPNRRARRVVVGVTYGALLLSGILPLLLVIALAARYAPILSRPELLNDVWATMAGIGRAAAAVAGALFTSARYFIIEQPVLIGWFIILAGLVFLWGGVFQRLLMQPAGVAPRN